MAIGARLAHAWNAFLDRKINDRFKSYGTETVYGGRPDRVRLLISNERSIISSIYNRMAVDVANVDMRHVRLDDQGRYSDDIRSGLNECLTMEANIDQASTAFRQDIVMTLFDKGIVALVPVDTDVNPDEFGSYDIRSIRVGEIVAWHPRHVRVNVYNDRVGRREELVIEKRLVAIVENPLYSVMNEPNSTLQRLLRKLQLLDVVDEQSSSGKLDLIIQLPYVVKSEARRQQANQRREDIEFQLKGSKYGIAYTDGTEKITQLNRPTENNLLKTVDYLMEMLYSQLGLTAAVMNGTANETEMLNYNNRTIEPILTAIVEAMRRSFLTRTARTQGQSVMYFRNPFKLVSLDKIAEIADKFIRNTVGTPNDVRGVVGWKPNKDPKADQLGNPNMPSAIEPAPSLSGSGTITQKGDTSQNGT